MAAGFLSSSVMSSEFFISFCGMADGFSCGMAAGLADGSCVDLLMVWLMAYCVEWLLVYFHLGKVHAPS
jgi:hypothetical protein